MTEARLFIRITAQQRAAFKAAAQAEGLTLSAWVKRILTLALRNKSET